MPSSFAAQPPFVNLGLLFSEVLAVTGRIIVMHLGRKVADKITAGANAEELAPYMVGAREDAASPR